MSKKKIIVVSDRPTPALHATIREIARKHGGDDCYALTNAWILNVTSSAQSVYGAIVAEGHASGGQQLLVAELHGTWFAQNAMSEGDCFRP